MSDEPMYKIRKTERIYINYEYKAIRVKSLSSYDGQLDELNELLKEGWEPVRETSNNDYSQFPSFLCILRRPKEEIK